MLSLKKLLKMFPGLENFDIIFKNNFQDSENTLLPCKEFF